MLLVTRGPLWRPSMSTAMMPLVAARKVRRIWVDQAGHVLPVTVAGEQAHVESEAAGLQ